SVWQRRSVQDISANTSDPRNRKPGGTARYRRPSWKGDSQKRSLNDLRRRTLPALRKTPGIQSTSDRFSLEALILLTRTESYGHSVGRLPRRWHLRVDMLIIRNASSLQRA